jgi:serine/threonine protein kinase
VDSFAFGVVLLELLTGRRPDQYDLKDLVKNNATMMRITRVLDEHLLELMSAEDEGVWGMEALQIAELALKCLAYDKSERVTVQEILPEIEGIGGGTTD